MWQRENSHLANCGVSKKQLSSSPEVLQRAEWTADSLDALEEVFRDGGIPPDEIHPVRLLNVGTRAFED